MRAVAILLLSLGVVLAGCASPKTDPAGPQDSGPAAGEEVSSRDPLKDLPQFCDSEDVCDFWDEEFHEYVVYDLDTYVVDALIIPGATPDPLVHVAAMERAVEAWGEGIEALGAPWFTANFTLNTYVIGQDVPPPEALADPEVIVVAAGGTKTIFGIGLEPKQIACILLGEGTGHSHEGAEVFAADCTGAGFTCVALNVAGGRGEERDLYDLVAHEVGHCLGAGHVGDAGDFRSRYAPIEDIMSYQSNATQVHCVSNINARVLEGVYGHLMGRPEEEWLPRGSFYAMDPSEYAQVECQNP